MYSIEDIVPSNILSFIDTDEFDDGEPQNNRILHDMDKLVAAISNSLC